MEKAEACSKYSCSVLGRKRDDVFASHENDKVLPSPLVIREGVKHLQE